MPYKDPEVRKAYNREYQKKWYAANRDKYRANVKKYKRKNATKVANQRAAYNARPDVRERATVNKRGWRKRNHERDKKTRRLYAKAHPEKIREWNRTYYELHRVEQQAKSRRQYHANPEYWKARNRRGPVVMNEKEFVAVTSRIENKRVNKK